MERIVAQLGVSEANFARHSLRRRKLWSVGASGVGTPLKLTCFQSLIWWQVGWLCSYLSNVFSSCCTGVVAHNLEDSICHRSSSSQVETEEGGGNVPSVNLPTVEFLPSSADGGENERRLRFTCANEAAHATMNNSVG